MLHDLLSQRLRPWTLSFSGPRRRKIQASVRTRRVRHVSANGWTPTEDAPELLLPCTNGALLKTGRDTTETLTPMYHFDKVGFKINVTTQDGASSALEEWAFPMTVDYED